VLIGVSDTFMASPGCEEARGGSVPVHERLPSLQRLVCSAAKLT